VRKFGVSIAARHVRTVASRLAGIGVEILLPLVLAGIAAAVVGAFIIV
jgi:hypothetical protein